MATLLFQWQHCCSSCWNKWAATWQNQQNECSPREDSDQPGQPPSLIRVLAVRMKKPWVLGYPLSAQRRLWSNLADAQADLSLHWPHTHFVSFVMSWLKWYQLMVVLDIFFCVCFTAHQDNFTHFLQSQSLGGAKRGDPQEKPSDHPQAELGLSHVWP